MPIDPAVAVFTYEKDGEDYDEYPGALSYASGSSKVVYFAFGFEAITHPENPDNIELGSAMRMIVMHRILQYLMN
ncbi:MAG: hypothetical protein RMJ14_04480 [Nitrososphaerota archaeon]|nr:hypothetical protein [Aigarchaeota archaeon]MDW8076874.1 hypothetical protein [Nitrososphaerota archaeon]